MKVTSSFDSDVVTVQTKDTLTALVAFEAPISESDAARPRKAGFLATVELVHYRSLC